MRARMRPMATVVHMDADAFFAAVEQRDKPSLRGRPVLVGGTAARGVVATASYEARRSGVRSAMPMWQARRLAPAAAVLTVRFDQYRAYSEIIMGALREVADVVEPLSIDEAFADLTGTPWQHDPHNAGRHLKALVEERTGLTVSVGVGRSKLIAKIASDADKPNGLVVINEAAEDNFLLPLPVRAIPGVGPVTAATLERFGMRTIADLRSRPLDALSATLGPTHASTLYLMARGLDDRPVEEPSERKSVGVEHTYPADLSGAADVRAALDAVIDEGLNRLRHRSTAARTVVVKLRYSDFTTLTRSATLPHPTADDATLRQAAHHAVHDGQLRGPVRLLGVSFHGLSEHGQLTLELATPREPAASPAIDHAQFAPATSAPLLTDVNARPGLDIEHPTRGRGWVVHVRGHEATVRFETATTAPATSQVVDLRSDPLTLAGGAGVTPAKHA